jgi:hypothetical protein
MLVRPSESASEPASFTSGLNEFVTSHPSGIPSPSVSALRGLVEFTPPLYSCTLVRPSASGSWEASLTRGFRKLLDSQPSGMPSPSVSAFLGLVPFWYSERLVRPSESESTAASLTRGFKV